MKDEKIIRNYYGLSWPTLVAGVLVVLTVALSYLYVISMAVKAGD